MTITVGVVDDHEMIRRGADSGLNREADLSVVRTSATVAEYLAAGPAPDVTILDLVLTDGTRPADNVRALVDAHSAVLINSSFDQLASIRESMRAGASGYILKAQPIAELAAAIRIVHSGGIAISPSLKEKLISGLEPRSGLTPRQREVDMLHDQGLTVEQTASQLGISPATVKRNREDIKKRRFGRHQG